MGFLLALGEIGSSTASFFGNIRGQMFSIIGTVLFFFLIDYIYRNKLWAKIQGLKNLLKYDNGRLELRGKTEEQKKIIRFFKPGIYHSVFPVKTDFFDSVLENKKKEFKAAFLQRALKSHGADADEIKEVKPVFMENFYDGSKYTRVFRDDIMRATEYQMSCLMFSNKQIYAYSLLFDTTSQNTEEQTKEYFYKDITGIDIKQEKLELLNQRHWGYPLFSFLSILIGFLLTSMPFGLVMYLGFVFLITGLIVLFFMGFKRTVIDNLKLHLTVPGDVFECSLNSGNIPAIQGMKAKIREKKK